MAKDKAVEDAYKALNFTNTVQLKSKYNGHLQAYNIGKEDGEKFSISDKKENEGTKTLLIN